MFEKLGKEIEALPIYQFVGFACHCWSRASWNEKDMLPAILAFWQNFLLWLVTTYHYIMTSMSFYFLYTLAYMVKTFFLYLSVLIGNVWQFFCSRSEQRAEDYRSPFSPYHKSWVCGDAHSTECKLQSIKVIWNIKKFVYDTVQLS